MTSTVGPPKTVVNANQLRSTYVYGNFNVMDNSSSSIPARAGFGRDVYIGGNLFLGNGAVDASGYLLNSSSNIEFPFNKTMVAVPVTCLNYIRNLTSDVQQQILDISGSASAKSKSFIDISFTGSINSIGKGTLDYIKTLTSDVQTQINNCNSNITDINNKVTYSIADITWTAGTLNTTNIANACTTQILSFSQSLNNISTTTFGFLSGVTSSIQNQINNSNTNISTVEYRTRDISWTNGTSNVTTIANFCNTSILSFSQSLNNISTTTFSYLSGVTSNIQQQINNIGGNPTGAVVAFAGTSSSLNGYLLCDGSYYSITQYAALYNVIGTTYGSQAGTFRVPNYQAVFLRGAGTQFVAQPVIGGAGAPVGKTYTAPSIGTTLCDQSIQTTVNTLTPNIQVKTFVTGGTAMFAPSYTFQYSNAVSSLSFDSTLDYTNYGNDNTFPAHTSVQYFIKY